MTMSSKNISYNEKPGKLDIISILQEGKPRKEYVY